MLFIHDIAQAHRHDILLAAVIVCVVGAIVTVRLFMRVKESTGTVRRMQIALAGLIGGTTIWSTHFVAMLSYEPGTIHSYDLPLTALTLVIAILGMTVVGYLGASRHFVINTLATGVAFGLSVSVMHFIGMSAYLVAGTPQWDTTLSALSVILGIGFGIVLFHRIRWPVTRLCWLGGTVAMILAVCTMHFVGMAAFSYVPDPTIVVPNQLIADTTLAASIFGVAIVIVAVGLAVLAIEKTINREAQTLLIDASLHDSLTGLPNRQYFDQQLREWAGSVPVSGHREVVMALADLSRFRQLNERYGVDGGDQVLCVIARRLSQIAGTDLLVARTGGDEFACLFRAREFGAAPEFCQRILNEMAMTVTHAGRAIEPDPRVGYAVWPTDTRDILTLHSKATVALQGAKADPTASQRGFDPVLEAEIRETAALMDDLGNALDNGQLSLHFQRQNRIRDETLIGFEALLRWQHPEKGMISPSRFIPLAESTGLICEIGLWVLREACAEASDWPDDTSISVNVAPQQLVQSNFIDLVAKILKETGLPGRRLELEITEASLIRDEENTLRVMTALRAMGIRFAMDDFGTGYSSLAMLQKFPFDLIKIDRAFIADVQHLPLKAAIVRATLLLGKTLGIPVLAEGIEARDELAFLADEGCDVAQGFYFGKPVTMAEARSLARAPRDVPLTG